MPKQYIGNRPVQPGPGRYQAHYASEPIGPVRHSYMCAASDLPAEACVRTYLAPSGLRLTSLEPWCVAVLPGK